jgi:hypothetical protein
MMQSRENDQKLYFGDKLANNLKTQTDGAGFIRTRERVLTS